MQGLARKVFIRYKVLHLLVWMLFSSIILFIYVDLNTSILEQWLATLLVTALCILPTYYAANKLVPRYLYRKRIGAFIGSLVIAAFCNTILIYLVAGSIYHLMTGNPMFRSVIYVAYMSTVFFIVNSITITIGCAVKIISDRFKMEQRLYEVEQENVRTELAFLRAQVNPHFLFNVLNTIYFQINKDNKEARASVEKLSEMLRYQLYECTTDMIDISKELAYIENYVAVQQLRMEAGTNIQIHTEPGIGSFKIAPLLILPLVENAFKHISHYKNSQQNKLYLRMKTEANGYFVVHVSNTYDTVDGVTHLLASGGLGLQNLKRRLQLLYPEKHWLDITRNERVFETTLKIQYHD